LVTSVDQPELTKSKGDKNSMSKDETVIGKSKSAGMEVIAYHTSDCYKPSISIYECPNEEGGRFFNICSQKDLEWLLTKLEEAGAKVGWINE
jgi:hypothetical protein